MVRAGCGVWSGTSGAMGHDQVGDYELVKSSGA